MNEYNDNPKNRNKLIIPILVAIVIILVIVVIVIAFTTPLRNILFPKRSVVRETIETKTEEEAQEASEILTEEEEVGETTKITEEELPEETTEEATVVTTEEATEVTTEEAEKTEPIIISGTGTTSTDFFEVKEGMTIFEFIYEGERYFIVYLYDKEGNEVDNLVYMSGPVIGRNGDYLPKGKYYLDIDVGDIKNEWKIVIKQPQYAEVKKLPYIFEGDRTDITDILSINGLAQVNYTYKGSNRFGIEVKTKYGEWEEGEHYDEGPCEGSIALKGSGEYLVYIETIGGDYVVNVDYKK